MEVIYLRQIKSASGTQKYFNRKEKRNLAYEFECLIMPKIFDNAYISSADHMKWERRNGAFDWFLMIDQSATADHSKKENERFMALQIRVFILM